MCLVLELGRDRHPVLLPVGAGYTLVPTLNTGNTVGAGGDVAHCEEYR